MTPDQIRTAILASPTLRAFIEAGNDSSVAAALTETIQNKKPINWFVLVKLFGTKAGCDIIVRMRGKKNLSGAKAYFAVLSDQLEQVGGGTGGGQGIAVSNLDMSDLVAVYQDLEDEAVLTVPQRATLTTYGQDIVHPTTGEVSDAVAIWRPNGTIGPIPA
jgi:hypothetical protein